MIHTGTFRCNVHTRIDKEIQYVHRRSCMHRYINACTVPHVRHPQSLADLVRDVVVCCVEGCCIVFQRITQKLIISQNSLRLADSGIQRAQEGHQQRHLQLHPGVCSCVRVPLGTMLCVPLTRTSTHSYIPSKCLHSENVYGVTAEGR